MPSPYLDGDARAQRVLPVDSDGNIIEPVEYTATGTRVNTATTTNIAAGAKAYSVTVFSAASSASPTLGGVAIPMGVTIHRSAPENGTLAAASVVTVSGDDVWIDVIR